MLSLPVPVSAAPPVVPAGRWSSGRTVPNLPGALTRQLSARLGVDATAAMRIALLYGDIEWQAGRRAHGPLFGAGLRPPSGVPSAHGPGRPAPPHRHRRPGGSLRHPPWGHPEPLRAARCGGGSARPCGPIPGGSIPSGAGRCRHPGGVAPWSSRSPSPGSCRRAGLVDGVDHIRKLFQKNSQKEEQQGHGEPGQAEPNTGVRSPRSCPRGYAPYR